MERHFVTQQPKRMQSFEEIQRKRRSWRGSDKWPSRADANNRLEPEAWPIVKAKFDLSNIRSIYTIGSCFARNIEEHMAAAGFEIPTLGFAVPPSEWTGRPNGIINKFTAPSVYQELEWAARLMNTQEESEREQILVESLLKVDDGAIDLELAGFVPVSWERARERRLELFQLVQKAFASDVVTITFGLIEAWWDGLRGRYIQQAPGGLLARKHPNRFHFVMLDIEEVYKYSIESIRLLRKLGRPNVKFLVTTSPVPLGTTFSGEDILIANTYAKSVLRAVCGRLAMENDDVAYIPSYENVVLTRGSNIWHDDLIHIKDSFVEKIVTHLKAAYFSGT